ncbi:MAG: hypothetical protein IKZ17_04685 [Bacteroidaceae bacterium]|nr:hypothetical protein [Bacteroidaceae bacterium]
MKKLMIGLAAALMLQSCEYVQVEDLAELEENTSQKTVTFRLSTDDWSKNAIPLTRGAMTADDTEMTDLWVFDYVGDELVQSEAYTPEDDDWGAPSLTLKLGTHHIYFVASRGDQPTVDEDAETITWGTPKDTFWALLTLNVTSGGNTSQSVTLNRVATKMRLQINDLVPEGITTLNIIPDTWYFGLNYTTGTATASETRERSVTVPSAYIGTTGRLVASFFGLSDATEWQTDIAVTAKDGDGNVIGSATITDAPFQRNRVSVFSGNLFNGSGSMDVTLDGTWIDDYTTTW